MMNLLPIVGDHWVHILVPIGFVFECSLDRKNDEKLTAFWNKNLSHKRELRPNEEITWKLKLWLNYRMFTFFKS
ncbi:NADH dehydrogenase [ubiquinone] 1 beta subcomplex subunit 1-like [Balaenoptera ricei]|uniref:NADH dehydrogenase [ubiquinone] 1 beta subcomplex subunit 1-like n=1 Tax=Balaenoptera ricei TaxID=2746895 RepID=UPI0028BE90C6|nr:NADH dehydrogenase [ubiquinone] 1 beta subcomplex subunit 1-like [Balaenoptera ricei]